MISKHLCLVCDTVMQPSSDSDDSWQCPYQGCPSYGGTITSAPEDTPMVEPTPKNKRLVQAYQSSNGETHKTLEAAVRADIETLFEDDLACGGDMMDYILTPKYRHKLIRLLKELD